MKNKVTFDKHTASEFFEFKGGGSQKGKKLGKNFLTHPRQVFQY